MMWIQWLRHRAPVVKNLAWLTGDRVIRAVVGFAIGVLLIRHLGPEQFGAYSLILAVASIFSILATFGTNQLLLRDFSTMTAKGRGLLVSAILFRLIGAVTGMALSVVAIAIIRPNDSVALIAVLLASSGFFAQAFDVIELYFQAQIRAGVAVRAKSIAFFSASALKLVLIVKGAPLLAFFVVIAFEAVLATIALLVALKMYAGSALQGGWRVDLGLWKGLLRQGLPLLVAGGALMLQARADQVMLGVMVGEEAVGQYSAALRMVEAMAILAVSLQTTLAPSLARAKLEGAEEYARRLLQAYRVMMIFFAAIAFPTMVLAPYIVEVLLGSEYAEAGGILGIFVLRLFFAHQGLVRSIFITNEGLFAFAMVSAIAGALINIVLNYLLIPLYGPIGAVWASLMSFGVTTILFDYVYPPTRLHISILFRSMIPAKVTAGDRE